MTGKERYWKYSLIIIVLSLGALLFFEFAPYLSGTLGAFTIYVVVRKQMMYLTEKKRMKRSLAAVILLLESILCFLIPLSLFVWLLLTKLQGINLDQAALVSSLEHVADLVQQKTGYDLLVKDNLTSIINFLPKVGQIFMASLGSFGMNLFILVFVLFFMLIGGDKMEKYTYSLLPFSDGNKQYVLKKINLIVKSNALGIPLLALIQGGVATVGYLIFGVPNPFFFGAITCFTTVIPMVGTALVWLPLSVYLALLGDWAQAIGLIAYAIIIVTNVDNLIRFMLQKRMANTHPLITVFGVLIGLSLFGFLGIIFGPLLLSVFVLCVDMCKKEYLD
ncbi:AI-2E family transporter [uncultured Bacteroides sp.]|uniref:AI-2E family transporter n=1 Tax=uncultured Bacteroides sp. TaxID=162156 RepID=UPI002AA616A6|nr:AI-2E family transporter [uncultured Bacteroides sp.]